jgi:hypothetical protein
MAKKTPRRKILGRKKKCGSTYGRFIASVVTNEVDADGDHSPPDAVTGAGVATSTITLKPKDIIKSLKRKVISRDVKVTKRDTKIKIVMQECKRRGKCQALSKSKLKEAEHNQHIEK